MPLLRTRRSLATPTRHGKARPRHQHRRSAILAGGVSILIMVGSASLLGAIHNQARRFAQVGRALSELEVATHQQYALSWEVVARQEVTPDARHQLIAGRQRFDMAFAEFRGLGPSDGAVARTQKAYAAYVKAMDLEMDLVAAGELEAARRVDEDQVDPTFDNVVAALTRERDLQMEAGERASLIQGFGSTALVIFVVGLAAILSYRVSRAKRAVLQMEALRESEERYRALFQNSSDVITTVSRDGRILYHSDSVERVLGYKPHETNGRYVIDIVHPDDHARVMSIFADMVAHPAREVEAECRVLHRDGSWRHTETFLKNLLDDPSVGGIVFNTRDVTDRKALQEELSHQAFHDPLTRLANRALFVDRVEHALARIDRQGGALAVLFLDLDDFKTVNDSLGHAAGDEVLTVVADRLRSCTRPEDTVARLGGDEFAILLEDVVGPERAAEVAERVLEELRSPLHVHDRELFIHATVGIALSECGGIEAVDLLRNADVAMYAAKARGKDRYELFQSSMHAAAVERLEMKADLQRALERHELSLYYQPIVTLADGAVVGLEALLRWHHPERGLLSPDDFVPLAEDTGLILPIGRWVLEEACREARRWQLMHPTRPPLTVNVNLSARQLNEPAMVESVACALAESALPPGSLILEITESALMSDTEATLMALHQLKAIGVLLAVDDFGTGYSSLSYLQRFPVDVLKIDRSFIAQLGGGNEMTGLTHAMLMISDTLRLETIAEGIESKSQVAELLRLECRLGQGFYFAGPLTVDEVDGLLAAGTSRLDDQSPRHFLATGVGGVGGLGAEPTGGAHLAVRQAGAPPVRGGPPIKRGLGGGADRWRPSRRQTGRCAAGKRRAPNQIKRGHKGRGISCPGCLSAARGPRRWPRGEP